MSDDDEEIERLLYEAIQLTRPLLRNITASVEVGLLGAQINVGERAVMERLLECDIASAPELVESLQLKRQYIARILNSAVLGGHIEPLNSERKMRRQRYRLTKKGKQVISGVRQRESTLLKNLLRHYSAKEIRTYYRLQGELNQFFHSNARREGM
ncbi:MarR family winged helix-turn-helix transcriptional regulator [Flexibacterium corallicola]|uniref:MarR family winged helix-turn-helix transcriptional regulator n=1 Tax=Flexibacterium corallicola TaxID=3037259 RepID=UPI00286F860E|nr:MarR family winged helix-turn-helix transcriptional regulator [Pseudovibrio sp. M1P-2-3]